MKTIAGYRLLAEIARGGMGIVHLAERVGTHELVVVKELKPELANDVVYRDMFVDEGRLAKRLQHAHIVRTDELFCEDGRWMLAMELLQGASLHHVRARMETRGIDVPVRYVVRVVAAILDGLHHAHERGVVHRDVSSQNVLLGWDGSVKLIDFGVAKTDGPRQATQVGIVKGSVPYLSPDHLEPKTIDRRADVFGAGVLLRELLTRTRMWGDADDLTIIKSLVAREIPPWPMTERGLSIPPGLRRVAERALAPRREDRYATAAEMRDALTAFLAATDAGGSLAEVGAWLSRALDDEREAFASFVTASRDRREADAQRTPRRRPSPARIPPPVPAARWLPSSDLQTRLHSLPPPRPPRPLPPRPSAAFSPRLPLIALVTSIFVGLAAGAYFGNETVDAKEEVPMAAAAE